LPEQTQNLFKTAENECVVSAALVEDSGDDGEEEAIE
jgi:hypothetical protein